MEKPERYSILDRSSNAHFVYNADQMDTYLTEIKEKHEKRIREALSECNVYEDFDGDKVIRVSDIKKAFKC